MNELERLEKVGEAASERPWRLAPAYNAVSTEGRGVSLALGADDRETYGGHLICETVAPADRALIVAAVNALPGLLAVVRAALNVTDESRSPEQIRADMDALCEAVRPFRREVRSGG